MPTKVRGRSVAGQLLRSESTAEKGRLVAALLETWCRQTLLFHLIFCFALFHFDPDA